MKVSVIRKIELTAQTIKAHIDVRHWEDSIINGEQDEQGDKTPCRDGNIWAPIITVDTGVIQNWSDGVVASINFKVCDSGCYEILDEDNQLMVSLQDYVPEFMCPEGGGYGDYISMEIDGDGQIKNWRIIKISQGDTQLIA
jgi:hypothetical protein